MKIPRWIKYSCGQDESGHYIEVVGVRYWHPLTWLALLGHGLGILYAGVRRRLARGGTR